ncbi:putative transporter YfdV [Hartmannibacter diazotrophicus]|uniref:Putative transporter YfdV n=2 Tax=Hartmannibacter diazotrophicus TaxID=1482074 RepID=A0A2C9D1A4_9HYPH|nr:putative transporter YfdV [Hartmannibacter diazotrophicus]
MASSIALALAPVFFTMAVGFVAGRARLTDNHNVESLNSLTMTFALPLALFTAMATAPRTMVLQQGPLFLIVATVFLSIFFGWFLLARFVIRSESGEAALQSLTVALPNLAGVTLPVAMHILGHEGVVQVAVSLAAGSLTISPLALLISELASEKAETKSPLAAKIARALLHALTAPVVLGPLLGLAVSLTGLPLGKIVTDSFSQLGSAAAGLALFLSGLVLSAQPLRLDWRAIIGTLVADVVRPAVAIAIVLAFAVPMEIGRIAILMAAGPSGFFGILFAVKFHRDSSVIGTTVIVSTLFGAVTLSLIIAVLFHA